MKRRVLALLCLLLLSALPALGELTMEDTSQADEQNQMHTDVYLKSHATLEIYRLSEDTTGVIGRSLTLYGWARVYNTLHYQWYLDGVPVTGASGSVSPPGMSAPGADAGSVSATLCDTRIPIKIPDFQKTDAGRYTLVVWDDFGNKVTSDVIVVDYRSPSSGSDPIPRTGDDGVAMNLLLGLMLSSGASFLALLMLLIRRRQREATAA